MHPSIARAARRLVPLALLAFAALVALPARARAQHADSLRACPVAAHALVRGVALAREDITLAADARCDATALAADSLVGRVTRRVMRAGEPLREPAIVPAPLIAEGDSVRFVLVQGGVRLTMNGTATAPALRGEQLWVRLGAKRLLRGVVVAPGLVTAK